MTESRLQRWARKKAETRQEPLPTTEAPSEQAGVPTEQAATRQDVSPVEQELSINQDLTQQEILAKYDLPDPDNLQQGTDITGFLREEIPEFLRRKALRSLWRSNPIFAILDGLNEYDEDFSKVTTPIGGVKTAYKVGKGGFLDPEKRAREREEREALEQTTEDTVRLSESEPGASAAQEARQKAKLEEAEAETEAAELDDNGDEPDTGTVQQAVESLPQPLPATEAETELQPRFRPRMQFES